MKDPTKNSLTMSIKIHPKGLESLYEIIDWTKMISIDPSSAQINSTSIVSIKFDPETD